jgi:hypothetical protein
MCQQIDAIDFYKARETKYQSKVDLEKPVAFNRPLGISFVTFENRTVSHRCVAIIHYPSLVFLLDQMAAFTFQIVH